MAQAPPPPPTYLHRRGPPEPPSAYDRPPPAWGASYVPPHQRPYGQSPLQHLQAHHATAYAPVSDGMDPEASDSDVSTTGTDIHRPSSPFSVPVRIPMPSARLESSEAVDNRLKELSRIEDRNVAKLERLRAKRKRMDDAIARKRDIQDRKIKAIVDARQRHNERIGARRAREDADFRRVDDQVEEEEMNLRRRLKRLKRGLAPDESPNPGGRSISNASASPPGPAYSTIPPPAKRHQSNPPGQTNSPRATHHIPPVQQPPAPAPAPSYSFYQGGSKPYPVPYQTGSAYSTAPPPSHAHSGPPPSTVPPTAPGPVDRPPFTANGRPASPLTRPPQTATPPSSTLSTAPPPRQVSSTYDTRPPPPASGSGFATVNAPPTNSGFATVNARSAATPPTSNSPIARSEQEPNKGPGHSSSYNSEPGGKSSSANSTPATGKRTPSTTHPYQMSEAFANRHHHCERVDDLNRGIWTSYGPGGSQEHPTGPAVEMYLRCNHDNCRRIDWRTVHGLQCHIVKSHEQPKGTIGSLEKALDRYGVPIKEVERYEREHGEGTGGTMADPKNLKIKNKTREQAGVGSKKPTPGSYGVDPNARPAGYKPSPHTSPTAVHAIPRFGGPGQSPVSYPIHGTPGDTKASPGAPAWSSINSLPGGSAYGPPRPPVDPSKQLQGDAVMKNSTPTPSQAVKAPEPPRSTGASRPYDFMHRHFEYPPRPHPPTPQGDAKSPKDAGRPAPWGVPARDSLSTPTHGPRWGMPVEKQAPTSTAKPDILQKAEQKPIELAKEKPKDIDIVMKDVAPEKVAEPPTQPAPAPAAPAAKEPKKAAEPIPATAPPTDAMDLDGEPKKEEQAAPAAPVTAPAPAPAAAPEKLDTDPKETAVAIGGPATGTRSAQSPLISNKPLSAPTSAKRMSRRSSMARKLSGDSGDGRTGVPPPQAQTVSAPQHTVTEPAAVAAASETVDVQGPDAKKAEKEKDAGEAPLTKEDNMDDDNDGDSITVTSKKQKDDKEELKDSEKLEPRTPPRRAASGRFTRKRAWF